MTIFDHLKSKEKKLKQADIDNEKALTEAIKLFETKREGMQEIKDSEGFREIVRFFEMEKEICENVFREGVKPEYFQYMQGKYAIVRKFLDFVETVLSQK